MTNFFKKIKSLNKKWEEIGYLIPFAIILWYVIQLIILMAKFGYTSIYYIDRESSIIYSIVLLIVMLFSLLGVFYISLYLGILTIFLTFTLLFLLRIDIILKFIYKIFKLILRKNFRWVKYKFKTSLENTIFRIKEFFMSNKTFLWAIWIMLFVTYLIIFRQIFLYPQIVSIYLNNWNFSKVINGFLEFANSKYFFIKDKNWNLHIINSSKILYIKYYKNKYLKNKLKQ